MIYVNAKDNLMSLMRCVGVMQTNQVLRFFTGEYPQTIINILIQNLINYRYLEYDEETGVLRYACYPPLKPGPLYRKIQAMWVIANHGSQAVRQIYERIDPVQYAYVTCDNISYDISVIESVTDAQLASQQIKADIFPDVPDDTTHIAIVDSDDMGSKLAKYAFDAYGVIDSDTKAIRYFAF